MGEKEIAKDIGARLVKNSGRGIKKGDMSIGKVIIDSKEVGKSFSLSRDVWKKVCVDAASYGWDHIPALLIVFKDGPKLMIMSYDDWEAGWGKGC
ncbi:MAG: hypothetical protein QXI19_07665 [Candidatus Caldarchaeum sp.]